MIAPEEIGAALQHAVRSSFGIGEDGAITVASRLFGYQRVGSEIKTRFHAVVKDLVAAGVLQERGGHLHVPRQEG